MDPVGGKALTFNLGNEEYGIPILQVKEIIGIMEITEVPRMPCFIRGVINLRGKIIPVMDLRVRFGIEAKEYNNRTCIIVIDIAQENNRKQIGIIVDTVSEVVNIPKDDVEHPPTYQAGLEEEFISGIGKVKGRIVILLDIDKILTKIEANQI